MSRVGQPRSAAARPGEDGEPHMVDLDLSSLRLTVGIADSLTSDICPVCKSSRYLNKSMRFLVNPECYHKMCESCVDRIFSHGPARCPIAGCNRTLRKHKFREQTFEDIHVEREIDIRKRVANIFNRREDDFDSLLDYNNYLNEVEDITFNLIYKVDVEETEKKISVYADQNAKAINTNAALASQESYDYSALQAAEREQARLRREASRREEEEERRARAEGRQDIIDRLATGSGDADTIAQESRVTLKKRLDKKQAADRQKQLQAAAAAKDATNGSSGIVIKGLKTRKAPGPEAPFDVYGGLQFKNNYHIVQDHYEWDWLNEIDTQVAILAGGYSKHEFHSRALCEAFSGLGVIIGEEKAEQNGTNNAANIGTAAAVHAGADAKDVKMEDPF
ncbi:CDK-activating kinase assembly factor [Aureobasidium subglaciale]|nr:CDK-activating kinase assembly factor [Aureobasidium subglaciale]KAI5230756.1 CDK-activating kinase assembly factor [Aureobasidium subglaciale]KAI5233757.1 CDK-activating kinase assembly factor [Aureobasidium subglaciale]KAI5267340.1 CDK-activating kinase assembly factor [Aureobasidium subglaciale]